MIAAHTLLFLLYIAFAKGQQQANPARNDDRLGSELDDVARIPFQNISILIIMEEIESEEIEYYR